jgi:hypothetical protein
MQVEGAGSAGVMLLAVIAIALIVGCWATPAEGASKPGIAPVVAMATEPTAGGGAASAEGTSCLDTSAATAIVMSFVGEGDGSAPSAPVDLAFGASFPVGGCFDYPLSLGARQRRRRTTKQSCHQYSAEQLDTFIV